MMNQDNDKKIILYMHAGSGNHGCESIANSMAGMLPKKQILISYYADEDKKYTLGDLYELVQEKSFNQHKIAHILYYAYRLITKDKESFIRYRFGQYLKKNNQSDKYPIAVSIGGDNYCYEVMLNDLFLTNAAFNAQGTKTVLLGCSVEPESLERQEIVDDLNKYSLILARETITYEALRNKLKNPERVAYLPDPAFTLNIEYIKLPEGFNVPTEDENGNPKGGMVGINISPLIQSNESVEGITHKNYEKLIENIIDNTDMSIALIPHVVWERNDDRKPLKKLYEKYKDTGRVIMLEDNNCRELKYIISKCRFFIGARTHATIAAYSTTVPTLVVGYSVKAKGIARDLFGTDENYVIPVQSLKEDDDLVKAFEYIRTNEINIRQHLLSIMPEYKLNALQNGNKIKELL